MVIREEGIGRDGRFVLYGMQGDYPDVCIFGKGFGRASMFEKDGSSW
jgi:4-aminobutyrate aminotransferase-like enzyme